LLSGSLKIPLGNFKGKRNGEKGEKEKAPVQADISASASAGAGRF